MLWFLCFAEGAVWGLWCQDIFFCQLYEQTPSDLKQILYEDSADGWLIPRSMQMPRVKISRLSLGLFGLFSCQYSKHCYWFWVIFFFPCPFLSFGWMVVWETCGGILCNAAQCLMWRDKKQPQTAQKKCHKISCLLCNSKSPKLRYQHLELLETEVTAGLLQRKTSHWKSPRASEYYLELYL